LEAPTTYEQVRAEAKSPGVDEWRKLDEERTRLLDHYEALQNDERYAPEYKAQSAWQRFEEVSGLIAELGPQAREKMLKSVESLERLSIPMPPEQSVRTSKMDQLALTQGEVRCITERINYVPPAVERLRAQGKKAPKTASPQDILREEYREGLDIGGPQGGAICRAVLTIARDRGIDIHQIVDSFRNDHHRGCLEDATMARQRAELVSSRVPQPPFPHPHHSRSATGTYRGRRENPFKKGDSEVRGPEVSRSSAIFAKKRRPRWK
jgi:hypothetical protein